MRSLPALPGGARTRFAPSPTGDLHLGGAWIALASWVLGRAGGGVMVTRVEDIDTPRVLRGSEARILEDLDWLGLTEDEGPRRPGAHGPYRQSERHARYDAALDDLARRGLTYPCDCSRAEIARDASAPHAGEETVYPGTCREKDPRRAMKRQPATRLRLPEGLEIRFDDGVVGPVAEDVPRVASDFVLRRGDGVYAYQLAAALDDGAMEISDVLRGDDLLASTARQIHLIQLLGLAVPRYAHLPMVVADDGTRLAKRSRGARVRALREAGISAETITGALAFGLGLAPDGGPRAPEAIVELVRERGVAWPRAPFRVPASWAELSAS